ncbi:transposase (plasmid) [Salmonella sp. SSDFZ69]|nr:transposase [Salmonella sp. SSDFZ69]
MRCRPSLVRGRAAQVNPGGFTTPARRPSVPHRTAGCGKSSLRPLMAGSSPSLPDGSNPSAAIVQSASDVQCSRLLKTTMGHCCKVSDEAAFCLIQRPYISKTLLTRRISPRGSP